MSSDFGNCDTCGIELTDDEEAYYSGLCWTCYIKKEYPRGGQVALFTI